MPKYYLECLSLAAVLDTRLRDIPTMLLRIGWLDDGDGYGLQIGPLVIWFDAGTEHAAAS